VGEWKCETLNLEFRPTLSIDVAAALPEKIDLPYQSFGGGDAAPLGVRCCPQWKEHSSPLVKAHAFEVKE
jgi:hypothetical protein